MTKTVCHFWTCQLTYIRATSKWEAFPEALTKNEELWERIQYPRHRAGNIVKDTNNQLRMKGQKKIKRECSLQTTDKY